MPTRNVFGWQKPCYLLGEGYVSTFKELMETTDWDPYGTGSYEKCANCMAHCGYEPTAAAAIVRATRCKALKVALRGLRTEGPMAPEISLENQRPAQYVFSRAGAEQTLTPKSAPPRRRRKRAKAAAKRLEGAARRNARIEPRRRSRLHPVGDRRCCWRS